MNATISRGPIEEPRDVSFATAVADSTTIDNTTASALCLYAPSGRASAVISWHGATSLSGPWFPVYLSSGSAATTSLVGGRVSVVPPELFSVHYLRGVGSVSTSAFVMKKG